MYSSHFIPNEWYSPYQNYRTSTVNPYHYDLDVQNDERFFGFGLLPFVAGLAIGPLLFNRPFYPPPYPLPYPVPYPYPVYTGFPISPAYPSANPPAPYPQQSFTPIYGGITENVNVYTK